MYRVSKILNNNGVIAINTEDNQEYVLLGKGIGFGKKVSQRFEVTEDTATYRLTEQTDRQRICQISGAGDGSGIFGNRR